MSKRKIRWIVGWIIVVFLIAALSSASPAVSDSELVIRVNPNNIYLPFIAK